MRFFALLLLTAVAAAQTPRNEVGVFAVGNLNPSYMVGLHRGEFPIVGGNKSSLGGGAEYRRYWNARNALGLLYVQNPSDGKLLVPLSPFATPAYLSYIWPVMRYDVTVVETETFTEGKFSPFLQEGGGVVVTNSLVKNSGISWDPAIATGAGVDYALTSRFALRFGATFLTQTQGCYGDPTCKTTWSVARDVRLGAVYRW
jgi:opacity protein-like surface antigen